MNGLGILAALSVIFIILTVISIWLGNCISAPDIANKTPIELRRLHGKDLPGHGLSRCGSCQMPWWAVTAHTTMYDPVSGLFPLCEKCWQDLSTPENRMPYYRALFAKWVDQPDSTWPLIEQAVLEGR